MKAYVILKNSLLAAAIGCALSSCYDPYYDHFSVSGSYSSGGSGVSYMYDSSGYPIYGYYGGRPIYAYDTFGSPIYSINLIRPNYYIPTWGPAPYYRGHYVRPHNCRPMAKPPMKPHFRPDHFRPGKQQAGPSARTAQSTAGLWKTRQFTATASTSSGNQPARTAFSPLRQ
ncbi:hypothetical protein M5E88_17395 [Akkermansia muciniphila]|nr:hypothetical protein M5E88_17395 [Akkermansia muciniphila]